MKHLLFFKYIQGRRNDFYLGGPNNKKNEIWRNFEIFTLKIPNSIGPRRSSHPGSDAPEYWEFQANKFSK